MKIKNVKKDKKCDKKQKKDDKSWLYNTNSYPKKGKQKKIGFNIKKRKLLSISHQN